MRIFINAAQDVSAAKLCVAMVTMALGLPYRDVFTGDIRRGDYIMIRQLALYVLYNVCDMSQTRVGRAFGRDRTTVRYACNVIEDQRDYSVFDGTVEHVETVFRQALSLLCLTDLKGETS